MDGREQRRELRTRYKLTHPEAGVHRLVNTRTGKALLASTPNLASVRNKLAFAQATNTPSALDYRLQADIRECGLDAFALEVLEVWQPEPELTAAESRAELAALKSLWREQQDPGLLY